MPYTQQWKGSYRFRRRVPDHLVEVIGKRAWLEALGTISKAEANRLVLPHIERTNQIIADAEVGNWPPIDEGRVCEIADEWWQWFLEGVAKRLKLSIGLVGSGCIDLDAHALAGDAALAESVSQFVSKRGLEVRPGSSAFGRLKRECQILHHQATDGYSGEIDANRAARNQLLDAADAITCAPQTLASAPKDNVVRSPPPSLRSPSYSFAMLVAYWARERNVAEKTRYGFERIVEKFVKHLGHDHASAVADTDVIAWKDSLVDSGLHPKTIKNHLTVLKTLYKFAKDNKRVSDNPAADVKYQAKSDKAKRLPYTDDDASRILEAARKEKAAHLRWVPWIAAFTGARLEEICGAMVADIETVNGIPCLHIRLDHREEGASLKNENSERVVPLHPAIITEGFLGYVGSVKANGPLFPDLTPDSFGKRGGTGTKRIGRWVRKSVGITDPRKAPNHSWRHRFKSVCRQAGIEEEIHDYLTGHGSGRVGRDYGDYGLTVLAGAIERIKSPVVNQHSIRTRPEALQRSDKHCDIGSGWGPNRRRSGPQRRDRSFCHINNFIEISAGSQLHADPQRGDQIVL
jgi:integrase